MLKYVPPRITILLVDSWLRVMSKTSRFQVPTRWRCENYGGFNKKFQRGVGVVEVSTGYDCGDGTDGRRQSTETSSQRTAQRTSERQEEDNNNNHPSR